MVFNKQLIYSSIHVLYTPWVPETFHALPVSVRVCAVIRGQIFDACDVTTLSGE